MSLSDDFVQLARIALAGRAQDIQLLIHRASKKYKDDYPDMTAALLALIQESPSRSSPLRKHIDAPLPVDIDSRLQLLRVETALPELEPILSDENRDTLNQILSERRNSNSLYSLGLHPTKSVLFTGPPGVGKTLGAKWIAKQLGWPLLVLDLTAVMSSFLGRTGNNIRYVLDYAKKTECVLLLDELDAIAKRRDDAGEIGELKRLVTVLLQEVDDWPASGLLIAATNHPDLLDPAVWRRFEVVVHYSNPTREEIELQLKRLLEAQLKDAEKWSKVLSYALLGSSFSEVERQVNMARKNAAIGEKPFSEVVLSIAKAGRPLSKEERIEMACLLEKSGIVSQRQANEITGVSRDTIRKYKTLEWTKEIGENIENRDRSNGKVTKSITKRRGK
jgi:SpoVK/Ycf46/Vps4 family AAA+-type ATPase